MSNLKDKFYYIIGKKNKNKIKQLRLKLNKELMDTLKSNKKFYRKYEGERCFIFGNGPSVKNIDFSLFKDEYTFTVNQFPRFKDFDKLQTNFHLFADERLFYVGNTEKIDKEALNYFKLLKESSTNIEFFSVYSAKSFIDREKIFDGANFNYYCNVLDFYEEYDQNFDITKGIPWFPTCVDYCIAIAIYMGFKEIYLLGCECTGFLKVASLDTTVEANFSYGYNISDNEAKRIKAQLSVYGAVDELEMWVRILKYYDYMAKFALSKNIKIVNCTDGGILYSFERKNINDVLNKK